MEKKGSQPPVLSFQNFVFKAAGKAAPFNLELKAGELAIFHLSGTHHAPALPQTFVGLAKAERGKVFFQGHDWEDLEPHQADLHRLTIGQVYDAARRPAWLENLDVEENVVLAQCFNPENSRGELLEKAESIAKEMGLKSLPHSRPSSTKRSQLALAQWVRALLPTPLRLLILDNPLYGLSPEHDPILLDALKKVRESGTAVLWLAHEPPGKRLKDLQPSHRFETPPTAFIPS